MIGGTSRTESRPLIRPEIDSDRAAVFEVNSQAFGQSDEARLVEALRDGGFARISLVAEIDGRVAGHILFSDMAVVGKSERIAALALAPLAVRPEFQRQGIGSALVRRGLELCREQPHRAVIVLGHRDYYPKFGFTAAAASRVEAPFSGDSFMALKLDATPGWELAGKAVYTLPFGIP